MPGDGPSDSPGHAHPSGREVSCPECGHSFVTDPPHPWGKAPCPGCGYSGD